MVDRRQMQLPLTVTVHKMVRPTGIRSVRCRADSSTPWSVVFDCSRHPVYRTKEQQRQIPYYKSKIHDLLWHTKVKNSRLLMEPTMSIDATMVESIEGREVAQSGRSPLAENDLRRSPRFSTAASKGTTGRASPALLHVESLHKNIVSPRRMNDSYYSDGEVAASLTDLASCATGTHSFSALRDGNENALSTTHGRPAIQPSRGQAATRESSFLSKDQALHEASTSARRIRTVRPYVCSTGSMTHSCFPDCSFSLPRFFFHPLSEIFNTHYAKAKGCSRTRFSCVRPLFETRLWRRGRSITTVALSQTVLFGRLATNDQRGGSFYCTVG
jgi:hypothetical protein